MTEWSSTDPLFYINENVQKIRNTIESAAGKAGRNPEDIKLIAVTKTVGSDAVNRAIDLGIGAIGENKAQELVEKLPDIHPKEVHFIGHLQTNKVKSIIGKVDLIHSVDSYKLAAEIDRQAKRNDRVQDILIEVNIGLEENKSGIRYEDVESILSEISSLKNTQVKGLMVIPPSFEPARPYFSKIYQLFIDIKGKKLDNILMEYLSMGMSNDYEEAILEGANIIRIGSAIFGKRNY